MGVKGFLVPRHNVLFPRGTQNPLTPALSPCVQGERERILNAFHQPSTPDTPSSSGYPPGMIFPRFFPEVVPGPHGTHLLQQPRGRALPRHNCAKATGESGGGGPPSGRRCTVRLWTQ